MAPDARSALDGADFRSRHAQRAGPSRKPWRAQSYRLSEFRRHLGQTEQHHRETRRANDARAASCIRNTRRAKSDFSGGQVMPDATMEASVMDEAILRVFRGGPDGGKPVD